MSNLAEAVQLIRMGNREEGRQILEEILEADENDEDVWLWLSAVVDSDEDREICLENVLALNPDNAIAQKGIAMVRAGRYNANEILGDLLEEEESPVPTTFIDDFSIGEQFEEDEELVMPGSMKTAPTAASKAAKKKKGGGGLNLRLIILVALGLLVVLVLAGVAAVSLLGGGSEEGTPVETPQAQETPAGGEAPAPAPTDTPTPAPTDTPTLTPTSALQLPTPKPTDPPTPTATTVVSPTPPR